MAVRTRAAARIAAAFAVVLVAGCSNLGAPMPASEPPSSPAPSSPVPSPSWPSGRPPFQTVSPSPSGSPASVPPARWQAILDDLAERGVTGEAVLVSAEAVTWQDSSLGCPSPGVMYTQALTEGMRVIVSVDGRRYDYRLGGGDALKLCEPRR